jgi:hypothetical protein
MCSYNGPTVRNQATKRVNSSLRFGTGQNDSLVHYSVINQMLYAIYMGALRGADLKLSMLCGRYIYICAYSICPGPRGLLKTLICISLSLWPPRCRQISAENAAHTFCYFQRAVNCTVRGSMSCTSDLQLT